MKKLILILAICTSVFALSEQQKVYLSIAKHTAKHIKAEDGMTFENTIQGMMYQESSARLGIIGDDKGKVYYYKHHGKQLEVAKKKVFKKDGLFYTWYQPYKNKYLKKVYTKIVTKLPGNSSLGPLQIQVPTAQIVIKKYKLKKYYHLMENQDALVQSLLYNIPFSATIASYYLKMNYDLAKKRGYSNPYFRTISRYNGGWNNMNYYNKIKLRIKQLKLLVN